MERVETDRIGSCTLAAAALYGIATARAAENFDLSGRKLSDAPALISALGRIKRAAALANAELGALNHERSQAIVAACDEVIAGRHHAQFIVNLLEGSGGTSTNMNANEVIANRALQILGRAPGDYNALHPNDHVNAGQSTNDVVPAAIKLAILEASPALTDALGQLAEAFSERAEEFAHVLKVGRTCMQAAQPITLGQEFGGYAAGIERARYSCQRVVEDLTILPLGGTAIGTGLGARPGFRQAIFRHLSTDLGISLDPPTDSFDAMQNADTFARVSAEHRIAAELIGKISLDLVVLSSGAASGIGEIRLPMVQAGSSIMPGKVNPVLPMMMQQVAFAAHGNDASIALACMNGQLEINPFEPLIAARILETMELLTRGCRLFASRCVTGIEANEAVAKENLLRSSALATAREIVL